MFFIPYHDDNPIRRFPYVTVAVIFINVLAAAPFGFYLPQMEGKPPSREMRVLWTEYGFVPAELSNLQNGQPVVVDLYDESEDPPPVQDRTLTIQPSLLGVSVSLISCMFLHGGWLHLAGNMLFFWIYGNNVEDRLGHVVFLVFYLCGGIAATLCHWLMAQQPFDSVPMIGASGAVAAVMGAYIVTFPKAKVHVLFLLGCVPLFFKVPAVVVLLFWIGEQLFAAYWEQAGAVTGVALWAHIGGFFLGAIAMPILAAGLPEPGKDWDKEARDQFDFEHIDPYDRIPPDPDQRDMWWEDFKEHGTRSPRPFDADQKGIMWDDTGK